MSLMLQQQLKTEEKLEQKQVQLQQELLQCKVKSLLHVRVQRVVYDMCSIRVMTQAVQQLQFDVDSMPLENVTKRHVTAGYACLREIERFIKYKDFGTEFKKALAEYYRKIPHNSSSYGPPATITTLKKELELLELLSSIELALKTMKKEKPDEKVNPVDTHYACLNCALNPMDPSGEEFRLLEQYLRATHGSTHRFTMRPISVMRVERKEEQVNASHMAKIGNRKLLWHGSRKTNFFGILSQGLRIAPPEAPHSGYMFGKGVYFADMASKSGSYCYATKSGETGFLLLAEVALGEENKLTQADYNASKLPARKHSTWGLGKTMPDPGQSKHLKRNKKVVVPCGRPVYSEEVDGVSDLLYNEFIVYDTRQIRMRYLLEVEFTFNDQWR